MVRAILSDPRPLCGVSGQDPHVGGHVPEEHGTPGTALQHHSPQGQEVSEGKCPFDVMFYGQ